MKLPPLGLGAPLLCPRCDTPATLADHCIHCALHLRQCGNCRGIAGPFDRYCGFCGFEMLRGERRSPLWRLWLLLALVPLAAGLGYGVWVARLPVAATGAVTAAVRPTPTPETKAYAAQSLGFNYAIPKDWTSIDYTRSADATRAFPFVVAARNQADQALAQEARGQVAAARTQSSLVSLGRPAVDTSLVGNASAPAGVLTSEVAPLLAAPPPGTKVEVERPVRSTTIGDRPAATVVLKLTRDGSVYYLERALIYSPRGGLPPLIHVEALVPGVSWQTGDEAQVETVIRSVRPA
jgi:hypothetical protein